jgi:predicted P-loop ATPase
VGARWIISAVARIFRPGAKADCCLILEGPQGIRKPTALRIIAGEYFTDELADLGSKDAAMQTRGVWIASNCPSWTTSVTPRWHGSRHS